MWQVSVWPWPRAPIMRREAGSSDWHSRWEECNGTVANTTNIATFQWPHVAEWRLPVFGDRIEIERSADDPSGTTTHLVADCRLWPHMPALHCRRPSRTDRPPWIPSAGRVDLKTKVGLFPSPWNSWKISKEWASGCYHVSFDQNTSNYSTKRYEMLQKKKGKSSREYMGFCSSFRTYFQWIFWKNTSFSFKQPYSPLVSMDSLEVCSSS